MLWETFSHVVTDEGTGYCGSYRRAALDWSRGSSRELWLARPSLESIAAVLCDVRQCRSQCHELYGFCIGPDPRWCLWHIGVDLRALLRKHS